MKLLVTGASGFVGANLVKEGVSRGHEVLATTMGAPHRAVLEFLNDYRSLVTWASVDVRFKRQVEDVLRESQVGAIIHGAAITSVFDEGAATLTDMIATNVLGTLNVLDAARAVGIGRVVFLSSGAVYGHLEPCPPVVGEDHPLRGDGPYAVSKIAGEQLCRSFAGEHGLSVTICRLGTVYGPLEIANPHRPQVSIPCRLVDLALRRRSITVFGASRRRPYCYVGDAARGVVDLALSAGLETDTFNLGAPERVTLADLLDRVSRLRPDVTLEGAEDADQADLAMTADDERPVLETARLERAVGAMAWCTLEDGLEKLMSWAHDGPRASHG